MLKTIILVIVSVSLFIIVWYVARALWLIKVSAGIQKNSIAFEQSATTPKLSILFLGDSTAFGTGAKNSSESTAGRLAQDFPAATIENRAKVGKKTADLAGEIAKLPLARQDLIVIQIGGNDTLQFTDRDELRSSITTVLTEARKRSDQVLLLTSGDVGTAPFFPPIISKLWSKRTYEVRDIFREAAKENDVIYLDFLETNVDETFVADISKYYSKDLLHPSSDGYAIWYREIKRILMETNIWEDLKEKTK